jgi:hypothetical protein
MTNRDISTVAYLEHVRLFFLEFFVFDRLFGLKDRCNEDVIPVDAFSAHRAVLESIIFSQIPYEIAACTYRFGAWLDHPGIKVLLMLLRDIGDAAQAVRMQTSCCTRSIRPRRQ